MSDESLRLFYFRETIKILTSILTLAIIAFCNLVIKDNKKNDRIKVIFVLLLLLLIINLKIFKCVITEPTVNAFSNIFDFFAFISLVTFFYSGYVENEEN